MPDVLLAREPAIRLAAFLGILAAMVPREVAAPRRRCEIPRVIRRTNNLALFVVDSVILRLTSPFLAVGLAVMAEEPGWGPFNNLGVPVWIAVIVSMLLLDLAIHLQQVIFHAVPGLWRLHRMHRVRHSLDPRITAREPAE
jgi:sterol desaturase/sphingolipid hydroxylase (fatty acid hydroxylase superfamily)